MLIDAITIPAGDEFVTDVCIIGAGPAGITLARELSGQDFKVCLLESGGIEKPDADTRSLGNVETEGDFVQIGPENRNRRFGGNSSYWGVNLNHTQTGVRLVPLDTVDFEERDWVPHSGWPFDREHLLPYYERAQGVMGSGPFAYDAEDWESEDAPQLKFKRDRLRTRMFQFGNGALFFEQYRAKLNQSKNVTTLLHANAVELETDETGQTVTRVRVATIQGKQFWVAAKLVIMAAGAVENTHLLLLSNKAQSCGLGNQHDLVGRFFMDHPLVHGGLFIPSDPSIFNRTALYDLREVNGVPVMGGLTLSDQALRREKLLNIAAWIFPRAKQFRSSEAMDSLKHLLSPKALAGGMDNFRHHARTVMYGMDDVTHSLYDKLSRKPAPYWPTLAKGGWSDVQSKNAVYGVFEVLHITEQTPDPNNRLVLGQGSDKLGRQAIRHISQWSATDKAGITRAWQVLSEEIEQTGLGRFIPEMEGDNFILASPGASHHIGVTRMHNDSKQGVVDANCQVHGVSNLFISSSSVFPTGGYANPTLTIVALSLRLADRVKMLMAQPARSLTLVG
jgi:choline dehydrogenase-like flavoprotein